MKVGGTYHGEWEVRSEPFTTTLGKELQVFETLALPGMVHIFDPGQMRVKPWPGDEPGLA